MVAVAAPALSDSSKYSTSFYKAGFDQTVAYEGEHRLLALIGMFQVSRRKVRARAAQVLR